MVTDLKTDAETLRELVERYRDTAEERGVDIESVTFGEALLYAEENADNE